jgi:hypothetical protein
VVSRRPLTRHECTIGQEADPTLGSVPSYPEDLDLALSRGDAGLLGIGWREIAGPLWRSPYRGVHVWSATDPDDPRQRVLDAAPLLPAGAAIGGWAAACLGGAVELDGRGPSGTERLPVLLCLTYDQRIRRGAELRVLRSPPDDGDLTEVDGIPVTTPLRTAFDLARTEPLEAAVVALDCLARGRPEFLGDLQEYVRVHSRRRGSARVTAAMRHATHRSRSGGETRLRLMWTHEARLAMPAVNPLVRAADGFVLGMPDLLDLETGLAGEYDGAGHRGERQHADDNAREEGLEAGGLVVVRFGSLDLGPRRRRSLHRIADGRRRAVALPPDRRLWSWEDGPLPRPTPHW